MGALGSNKQKIKKEDPIIQNEQVEKRMVYQPDKNELAEVLGRDTFVCSVGPVFWTVGAYIRPRRSSQF